MDFSEQLITEYRIHGNKTLAKVCRWVAVIMFVMGMLNVVGVFVITSKWMYFAIGNSILIALLPTLLFDVLSNNSIGAQYIALSGIVLMVHVMYAVLSYHSVIMLVFPLVCACLYSEKNG